MDNSESNVGIGKAASLILILFAHGAVGLLVSWAAVHSKEVYANIKLPIFATSEHLFWQIWIGMYAVISVALWLVWLRRGEMQIEMIMPTYGAHLLLQILWTLLSFDIGRVDAALFVIVIMVALTFWLMCFFWRVHFLAGLMMTFYHVWLIYALAVNLYILLLNGVQLGS